MIQIIQRARSEHSVLEVFGRDVVMTQMQYRDSNKPVVNAGPGIPKPLSKSGIHDQSRVSDGKSRASQGLSTDVLHLWWKSPPPLQNTSAMVGNFCSGKTRPLFKFWF